MQTTILNYRIIITPDVQTGTWKWGFTAFSPTLWVADDWDTIDEALENVQKAITIYIESLVEDNESVPVDHPEIDIVTTTQVKAPSSMQLA